MTMTETIERDEVDEQIAALPTGLKVERLNPWLVHITEMVDDGAGEPFEFTHSLVQSDHEWVKARWDRRAAQWQSRDISPRARLHANRQSFVFAYGPTPESLVDVGIRTYPTLAKAIGA